MKKKDKKLASNGKISMLQGEYKARFEPRMICFSFVVLILDLIFDSILKMIKKKYMFEYISLH